jgi:hypothetical protein
MGLGWSKKVPLSRVTASMLVPKSNNKKEIQTDVQLLSPKLCSNLLRNSQVRPGLGKHNCTTKELTFLQNFLSRSSNLKSCRVSDLKKCLHKRRVWETEIERAILKTEPAKISKAANRHLTAILNTSRPDLYFKFRHKKLLTHVILPQLENLRLSNTQSVKFFRRVPEIYGSVFHHKLAAKDLRRNPKGLASDKGGTRYFLHLQFYLSSRFLLSSKFETIW